MRRIIPTALVATAVLTGATAHANDSSFGGQGADLTPLEETRVRMVSERIVMEQAADPAVDGRAWRVTATYRFENPTDEEVTLQMGFPESRCSEEMGDCVGRGGEFRRMRTTVRGERVEHRLGDVRKPEWPDLGRVFLYDVTLAPREEIEVVHTYVHDRSFSAPFGEHLYYLTRTGRLWNGPIERAEFIVRVPYIPLSVIAKNGYDGVRRLVREDGRPTGITLRFEMEDFQPREDFEVILTGFEGDTGHEPQPGGQSCPRLAQVRQAGEAELETLLADVPTDRLELCATALASRWGGPVPDATRQALESSLALEELGDGYHLILPRPHPEYEPSWLPDPEREYVTALESVIASRGGATAPAAEQSRAAPGAETAPSSAPAEAPPNAEADTGCGRCWATAAVPERRNPAAGPLGLLAALGLWRARRRRRLRRGGRRRFP